LSGRYAAFVSKKYTARPEAFGGAEVRFTAPEKPLNDVSVISHTAPFLFKTLTVGLSMLILKYGSGVFAPTT
jgi:hypothetical protein